MEKSNWKRNIEKNLKKGLGKILRMATTNDTMISIGTGLTSDMQENVELGFVHDLLFLRS
jgi:hypothetical protein